MHCTIKTDPGSENFSNELGKFLFDILISYLLAETHLLSDVWVSSQNEQAVGTGDKTSVCLSLKQ